ncbi:MAG TPA: MAPEG family protein [Steroidobacteraceae bacterium]|nr:MAPEG family protein [Steroidobacteraceae bacterium]
MPHVSPPFAAAVVTLLIGTFYFFCTVRVGILRGRHNVRAPATSGHPLFERAYRVQLNTLEQLGIILPFLWVAALYPIDAQWLAPLLGVVWLLGRILYLRRYMADPQKRLVGAGIGGLANLAMLAVALCGLLKAWFAGRA